MPALTRKFHAAGDTGLNNASVPITGERAAPLPVDGGITLAEQHRIPASATGSGRQPTTVVGTAADADHGLQEAMLQRCPALGLPVFPDRGTRAAVGVTGRG
ncbi:hypothetical protein ACIQVL_40755 [Streptomyces sp. NPDC090499]|uniref:hypothetical protein n=1 Tax=Streptomyces sp. NPDC090499 TaxID=3365965 RepID=UPI003828F2F7